jgi:hypothetical protein
MHIGEQDVTEFACRLLRGTESNLRGLMTKHCTHRDGNAKVRKCCLEGGEQKRHAFEN